MTGDRAYIGDLEQALSLQALEEGEWATVADVHYEANNGMFGGWTAAVLLKSVMLDERAKGLPSAITLHYINRITPGSNLRIRTLVIGGGRSISHWRTEIHLAGESKVMAYASIVMAQRRPSDSFMEWSMPEIPPHDDLSISSPPGSFGERTIVKPVFGFPPFAQPSTKSLAWVKERSGRPLDSLQLAYLSDTYPPRIWYQGVDPRPSATITLSTYFHATTEELESIGDDYVLSEVTGTRGEQSTVGSQARIWSKTGVMLATTEQLHWFR